GADVLRDLMERSRRFLAEHPACQARAARGERAPTSIWLWGQGGRPRVPTLRERFGIEGSVIAAVDLVNGLGVLAGLRKIAVPGDEQKPRGLSRGYNERDAREHGIFIPEAHTLLERLLRR